jgi:hypothetical protein
MCFFKMASKRSSEDGIGIARSSRRSYSWGTYGGKGRLGYFHDEVARGWWVVHRVDVRLPFHKPQTLRNGLGARLPRVPVGAAGIAHGRKAVRQHPLEHALGLSCDEIGRQGQDQQGQSSLQ